MCTRCSLQLAARWLTPSEREREVRLFLVTFPTSRFVVQEKKKKKKTFSKRIVQPRSTSSLIDFNRHFDSDTRRVSLLMRKGKFEKYRVG